MNCLMMSADAPKRLRMSVNMVVSVVMLSVVEMVVSKFPMRVSIEVAVSSVSVSVVPRARITSSNVLMI